MRLFVVIEGLDGSGKTSTIKELLRSRNWTYSKGIGSSSFIGKISRKLPSNFMFLLELGYVSFILRLILRKNKIILQDRYDTSVISYLGSRRLYNRIIETFFRPFLLKPDALVYFSVSIGERIKRLKEDRKNKYHVRLSKDPELIREREERYIEFYSKFKGRKTVIDTTGKSVKESSFLLEKFILNVINTQKGL